MMTNTLKTALNKSLLIVGLIFSIINFAQSTISNTNSSVKIASTGAFKNWGSVDGISMIGLVQGPSSADTQLQVACVFEYTDNDIHSSQALPAPLNGLVHLDDALKGELTQIRKTGQFQGHALETLLITPPKGSMSAKKIIINRLRRP